MSKTCNNCGNAGDMATISFAVHEAEVARMERTIRRQWIALVLAIVALFVCNMMWMTAYTATDRASQKLASEIVESVETYPHNSQMGARL